MMCPYGATYGSMSTWDLAPNQQPLLLLESIHRVSVCVCVCLVMSDSLRPYGLKRSLPVSSVHGILQASISIPEWVAMPSSRGSSPPRDGTCVSCIAGRFFTTEPPGKPPNIIPTCKLPISVPTHWVGSWNAEMDLKPSFPKHL